MIKPIFDSRLLLYFLLILGIIAISIWTLFFIEIIKANNQILQILSFTNNTKLFLEQQTYENGARDEQRYLIVKDTNRSINTSISHLENNLTSFMKESENRSKTASDERDNLIKEIRLTLKNQGMIFDILSNLAKDIKNITQDNQYDLNRYADRGHQYHQDINKTVNEIFKQLNTIK